MLARTLHLSTLAACLWAAGCQQVEYKIDVHDRADGTFDHAEMPDGTVIRDLSAYEKAASSLAAEATEADTTVTARILHDAPQTSEGSGDDEDITLPFGYAFTAGPLRLDHVHVGGCVNAATNVEYSLRLYRNNAEAFDLQLAGYSKGGKRCIGAYEDLHGLVNWCSCGVPFTPDQVRNTIYVVCLGVGLSVGTAWLVSEVGAPIVMGALTLVL